MIELSLKGQKLAVHTPLVVAGTVDYLTVQIHRDSPEWEGLSLHIFFQQGGTIYELLTEGDFIGTDAHINLTKGEWSVSVVGYEFDGDEMVEKVTTNTIGLTVAPAPPDAGDSLPDIPPTAYEQIEAIARSVREDADNGVFDGEKGDTSDQGPIGLTPDFSIGTVSTLPEGSSATASISGTAEFPVLNLGIPKGDTGSTGETGEQGPPGQDGASITVSSNVIEYQEGSSGTTAPTGTWSATIPSVTAGNFLWTRITTTFSDGATAVSYSVSRMGVDGSGSVVTVNNVSPDSNGNVELDADDVGALPDTYTAPVSSVNGYTGAVTLNASDVGALPSSYTAPVSSVNGQTGAVSLDASDVGALPSSYTAPVSSVNGQTGAVSLDADDVGALPDTYTAPVDSVNGKTGTVALDYADVQEPFGLHVDKALSSTGWYRVLQMLDRPASVIRISICRLGSSNNNETHTIEYHTDYGGNNYFLGEHSVGGTRYIDKIRCTYDSTYAYIDIHFSASESYDVYVDFSAEGLARANKSVVVQTLQAVADAPTGETVLSSYNFATNSPMIIDASNTSSVSVSANTYKTCCSFTLPEGVWLIIGQIRTDANGANVQMSVSNSTGTIFSQTQFAGMQMHFSSAAYHSMVSQGVVRCTAETVYNLVIYSSIALTVGANSSHMRAVRLG